MVDPLHCFPLSGIAKCEKACVPSRDCLVHREALFLSRPSGQSANNVVHLNRLAVAAALCKIAPQGTRGEKRVIATAAEEGDALGRVGRRGKRRIGRCGSESERGVLQEARERNVCGKKVSVKCGECSRERPDALTLPSMLAISNSAAGLVSTMRALPSLATSRSSLTLIRASCREDPRCPTPGSSHNGSCHPGHVPLGSARKAAQREAGVEGAVEGGDAGVVPHVGQDTLRERVLIER